MPRRNDARRFVLQMLYLVDQNPDADVHRIRENMERDLKSEELVDFAWSIFRGVRDLQGELDESISKVADNWRIDRMAPTDRNVIRLAAYEMRHLQTPAAVALNEAVELAREFGNENSSAFVNGILDKLIPESESEAGNGAIEAS